MKRSLFSLLFVLVAVVPAALHAQQDVSLAALLPEAPLPQGEYSSSSQQTTPAPPAQSAPTATAQNSTGEPRSAAQISADQLKAEEKQRLLGIVPAFNTVQSGQAAPLTKAQKFHLWYLSSIDPFTFGVAGIDAGIEQAENSYPEYHQGIEGFAKRYGASYADSVDGNFWGNAVLPSLLHQDPRYFRLGHGSAKRRLWYAVLSTVRCKNDDGKWAPSYSNIGGNLIGGAISNVYYPASDRGVGLTLERGFTVTAEGAIGAVAFEFYPDAIAYLQRHHHKGPVPPASATPPLATPMPH